MSDDRVKYLRRECAQLRDEAATAWERASEARNQALEEAAAYHARLAEECAHHRARLNRYSGDPKEARSWHEFKTREDWHRTSAAAIRALKEEG